MVYSDLGSILYGIAVLVGFIIYLGFWFRMIGDAIANEPATTKWGWVLFIFVFNILGALVYYFAKKRTRDLKNKRA